jgi:hypothetical protein
MDMSNFEKWKIKFQKFFKKTTLDENALIFIFFQKLLLL